MTWLGTCTNPLADQGSHTSDAIAMVDCPHPWNGSPKSRGDASAPHSIHRRSDRFRYP